MLNEETRRKLREMKISELVEALDLKEMQAEYMALSFDGRMNLAVDYTYSAKNNAKVHRLINAAKFRTADASLVNVYYEKRELDKDMILTLGTGGFIEKNKPVVFNGFTGSGKAILHVLSADRLVCKVSAPDISKFLISYSYNCSVSHQWIYVEEPSYGKSSARTDC